CQGDTHVTERQYASFCHWLLAGCGVSRSSAPQDYSCAGSYETDVRSLPRHRGRAEMSDTGRWPATRVRPRFDTRLRHPVLRPSETNERSAAVAAAAVEPAARAVARAAAVAAAALVGVVSAGVAALAAVLDVACQALAARAAAGLAGAAGGGASPAVSFVAAEVCAATAAAGLAGWAVCVSLTHAAAVLTHEARCAGLVAAAAMRAAVGGVGLAAVGCVAIAVAPAAVASAELATSRRASRLCVRGQGAGVTAAPAMLKRVEPLFAAIAVAAVAVAVTSYTRRQRARAGAATRGVAVGERAAARAFTAVVVRTNVGLAAVGGRLIAASPAVVAEQRAAASGAAAHGCIRSATTRRAARAAVLHRAQIGFAGLVVGVAVREVVCAVDRRAFPARTKRRARWTGQPALSALRRFAQVRFAAVASREFGRILIAVAPARAAAQELASAAATVGHRMRRAAGLAAGTAVGQRGQFALATVVRAFVAVVEAALAARDRAAPAATSLNGVGQTAAACAAATAVDGVEGVFAAISGDFVAIDVALVTARDQASALGAHGRGSFERTQIFAAALVDQVVAVVVATVAHFAAAHWTVRIRLFDAGRFQFLAAVVGGTVAVIACVSRILASHAGLSSAFEAQQVGIVHIAAREYE
ncbi:MAG: hypothetical protein RL701_6324, partial [Pseudomonadota bacterium]